MCRVARSESGSAWHYSKLGAKRGQDLPEYWEMIRPDERFAQFCADAHEHARHTPLEFRTLESYRTLIAEIGEQFELFLESGYTFLIWRRDGQPYRNSQAMGADVRNKHRLFVYPTTGMSPDHPLAQMAMAGWSWNDVFVPCMISWVTPLPASSSAQWEKRRLSISRDRT